MVERKMVTGQRYGLGIGGCKRLCRRGRGHSLVTLFSLSGRLRTDRCIRHLGKSQIYYPEHILVYGRLEDLLLSCRGSGPFRTDCQGFILVEEVLTPH